MKQCRRLLALLALAPAWASAQLAINALPVGGAISGGNFTVCDQAGVTNKCTYTQVAAFVGPQITPTFSQLTNGTNTATLTMGTGGTLTYSGTGVVNANQTGGVAFGTFATANAATPPAIGGTTPAAGAFSTLSASGNLTTNVTGSTQCLHTNSSGVVSGTGSDCGAGGGSSAFSAITGSTNTTAAMLVGTGASLGPTGTGTITATGLSATLPVSGGGTGAVTLTGPLKGTGTSAISPALAADIYALWSGTCSSSTFLRGDGSCQTPGGGGNVSTTGTPASGNLTKFSAATTVTNADLSGDVTTAGTLATTVVKVNGATIPASAAVLASNSSSQLTALTLGNNLAVASGVLATTQPINAQTGTTYTVLSTDAGKLLTFNNGSAIAVTLPVASSAGFTSGFSFDAEDLGNGSTTITPTTSTINGASTMVLAKNTGCTVTSDGTNYQVSACTAVAPAAAGTVTNTGGALTANSLVLGAGSSDTKVIPGIVTDGTSKVTLGVAGTSVGAVAFNNATSGAVTLSPPTGALGSAAVSLPGVTATLEAISSNSVGSGTSMTPNCAYKDNFSTNTAAAGTFTVNAPTGCTALEGQPLIIHLNSTNVQTFAWNAAFVAASGGTLPTATSGGSVSDWFEFLYDSGTSKWGYVASTNAPSIAPASIAVGGTADDTAAVQAVIAALPSTNAVLYFQPGVVYKIGAAGLSFTNFTNLEVDFNGAQFQALADTTQNAVSIFADIMFTNCTNCKVHGGNFDGKTFKGAFLGFINCTDDEIYGNYSTNVGRASQGDRQFGSAQSTRLRWHDNTAIGAAIFFNGTITAASGTSATLTVNSTQSGTVGTGQTLSGIVEGTSAGTVTITSGTGPFTLTCATACANVSAKNMVSVPNGMSVRGFWLGSANAGFADIDEVIGPNNKAIGNTGTGFALESVGAQIFGNYALSNSGSGFISSTNTGSQSVDHNFVGNTAIGNEFSGYQTDPAAAVPVLRVTLSGNRFEGNAVSCMYLNYAQYFSVSGNLCIKNDTAVTPVVEINLLDTSNNLSIVGNTILPNTNTNDGGISFSATGALYADVTIDGNTITCPANTAGTAISLNGSGSGSSMQRIAITGNNLSTCASGLILRTNGASDVLNDVTVANNTLFNMGTYSTRITSFNALQDTNLRLTGNSGTLTIDGNTIPLVNTGNVWNGGAGTPFTLSQTAIPVGLPPSGFMQADGTFIIGQAPTSSATASFSATSGAGVTMTMSAATLLGTAVDVGRVLTILDTTYKYATITAASSTTVATVTLTGTLSGTGPFANNVIWLSGGLSTNSGTQNTTTFSVPLPHVYPAAYFYFPTSSPVGTVGTNVLYAVMSSSTVGKVYNNQLVANTQPAIVSSPTTFSGLTPAAYTQTTGVPTLFGMTVPANSMGLNGQLHIRCSFSVPYTAGAKSYYPQLNGATVNGSVTTNANLSVVAEGIIANSGVANVQSLTLLSSPVLNPGVPILWGAIDTTSTPIATLNLRLGAASDYNICESHKIWVEPN